MNPGSPGATSTSTRIEPPVQAVERGGRDDGQHAAHPIEAAHPAVNDDYPPRTAPLATRRQRTETAFAAAVTATGLSTTRAKWSSDPPSAESAFVNMNGAPVFRALIAPRYSLTIW